MRWLVVCLLVVALLTSCASDDSVKGYRIGSRSPLDIVSHEYVVEDGKCCIEGTVENCAGLLVEEGTLRVVWYEDNDAVRTSFGHVYNLDAGEAVGFRVPEDGWAGQPTHYTVEVYAMETY